MWVYGLAGSVTVGCVQGTGPTPSRSVQGLICCGGCRASGPSAVETVSLPTLALIIIDFWDWRSSVLYSVRRTACSMQSAECRVDSRIILYVNAYALCFCKWSRCAA